MRSLHSYRHQPEGTLYLLFPPGGRSASLSCPQLLCMNLQTTVGQDMNFCGVREAAAEVARFAPLPPRHEKECARATRNQFTGIVDAAGISDEPLVAERAVGSGKLVGDKEVRAPPAPALRRGQPCGGVPGRAEKQVVPTVERYYLWHLHLSEVPWYAHRWQHLP